MNSKHLHILFAFFSFSCIGYSQNCVPGNSCFDAPLICGAVLDGLNSSTGPSNDITDPDIFCGIVENNQWIRFVACEPEAQIDLIVNSCNGTLQGSGLQAQIFATDDCFDFTSVSNCFNPSTATNGTLNATGLIPGNIYYLMIDGYASDLCDFTIDVVSGIDTDPPTPVVFSNGMISGPNSVCPGETATYTVAPPVCDNASASGCPLPTLPPADFTYNWILPPGASIIGDPNSGTVEITWGNSGGTLDVILQNNTTSSCGGCNWNCSTEVDAYNVEVNNIPSQATTLPTVYICEGESYEFCGNFYDTTIDAVCSPDCITGTIQPIVVLPTVYNDLDTITLCNDECFSINGQDFCDPGFFTSSEQTNTECTVTGFFLENVFVDGFFTPDGILTPTITSVEIIGGGMSSSGNLEYEWMGPGIDATNSSLQNPIVTQPGLYTVTITDPDTGCTITVDVIVLYQDNDCNLPVPPSDSCMGAPLFCGPILDGYCSFTDPFSPSVEGNLASEFCYPIENNSWIRFLPCQPIVELEINVGECTLGQGVEAAIIGTEDCELFTLMSNCIATDSMSADTLVTSDLIPGQIYYLMIDGIAAAACNWEVNIISGVSTDPVSLTQTSEPELVGAEVVCLGETHTYTAIPPVCELTGGDNCPFDIQLDSIEIEWILPDGAIVVSQTGYEIEIEWDSGQGGQISALITSGLTDDAAFCASSSTCGSFASIDVVVNYFVDYLPAIYLCEGQSYTFCGTTYDQTIDAVCLDSCGQTVQPIIVSAPVTTDLGTIYICEGSCYNYDGVDYCNEEKIEIIQAGGVCTDTVRFEIDYVEEAPLTVSPVIEDCDIGGVFYRIVFDITGGVPPYFINGMPVTSTTFISNPILSGAPYSYEISHSAVCSDSTVLYTGSVYCNCTTEAGTMAQDLLINCAGETVTAQHLGDEFLDNDDTFEYILHSGDSTSLVDALEINFTGAFGFLPGQMNYGQIYYISYVAGNAIDGGYVDLNSICLSVAIGQPVVFYPQPVAEAGMDLTLSCNQPSDQLQAINNNSPSISFSWTGPDNFVDSTLSPTVSIPGTYLFTTGDSITGCIDQDTAIVFPDFAPPTFTTAGDTLDCNSPEIQLIGSSPDDPTVDYQWKSPSGLLTNQSNILANEIGDYELIVTAINGCMDTALVSVVDGYIYPEITAAGGELNCTTPSIPLTVNSSVSSVAYSWNGPGSFNSTDSSPDVNVGGLYYLEVRELTSGCVVDTMIEVIDNVLYPLADAGSELTLDCNFPTLNLNPGNNSSGPSIVYSWVGPDGFNSSEYAPLINTDGEYILTVEDTLNGCANSSAVMVLADFEIPNLLPIAGDTLNCYASTITLNGNSTTPGISYQWVLPNGDSLWQQDLLINTVGTYELLATAPNGCQSNIFVPIYDGVDYPEISAQGGVLNCYFPEIALTANSGQSNVSFAWTGPGGFVADTAQPTVGIGGNYALVVMDLESGCTSDTIVEVIDEIIYPIAESGTAEALTCSVTSMLLNGAGSTQGAEYNYQWSGPPSLLIEDDQSLTPTVFASGWYTLEVLNTLNGCTQKDSVFVPQNENIPELLLTDISPLRCHGDSNAIVFVDEVVGGIPPYTFGIDDGPLSSADQFANLKAGDYLITLMDGNGCEYEQLVTIDQPPLVEISLGEDIYIDLGESATLNAIISLPPALIQTLRWQSSYQEVLENETSWEVSPFYNSTYNVLLSDANNCQDTAQVRVWVNREIPVFIPSGFSPNGDLSNDYFTLYAGAQVTEIKVMRVFSRWGELVFERTNFAPNDPELGWNGQLKGQTMNDAVFVYYFEVESIEGLTYTFSGDVMLVR